MHQSSLNLKLGTRRSLLAWAQSSWVARTLEKMHPGLIVELVGIDTTGDKILDKPLSQIDGKEFFTAELDHALLRKEVDFTVHSMKDLSLDRPDAILLACVPKRELPHDVVIFHASVIERLKNKEEIRVGTSSPRRLTLIPEFLKQALPRFSNAEPYLRFVEIRGNVNTRLGRIHEPATSDRKLDAVVLAFAGLERLALDQTASIELWKLFQNTKLMVLPLKECPTAPAQGALAIEAHRDRADVLKILHTLHDEFTVEAVKRERAILQEWGGGCHQKLGASVFYSGEPSGVLHIKGEKPNGERVTEVRALKSQEQRENSDAYTKVEASDVFDFKTRALTGAEQTNLQKSDLVFVAHSRALELSDKTTLETLRAPQKHIWVSGTKSWLKLAREGIWVEGCLEGRGFDKIAEFRARKLLRFGEQNFAFLSHDQSPNDEAAESATLIATYTHAFREIPKKVLTSEQIYWSSGLPFEAIWSRLGASEKEGFKRKTHACGPGRTAAVLQKNGIQPKLIIEA